MGFLPLPLARERWRAKRSCRQTIEYLPTAKGKWTEPLNYKAVAEDLLSEVRTRLLRTYPKAKEIQFQDIVKHRRVLAVRCFAGNYEGCGNLKGTQVFSIVRIWFGRWRRYWKMYTTQLSERREWEYYESGKNGGIPDLVVENVRDTTFSGINPIPIRYALAERIVYFAI